MKNILLFLIGLLVFILPIPHTIAIRNITALLILLSLFFLHRSLKTYKISVELKNIILILVIETIWIYFVAFFISDETSWSLGEIRSQWITPMLYFTTFVVLGMYSTTQEKTFKINIYTVIFIMFFIHVLFIDLSGLKYYIEYKRLLSRFPGLTGGPDKANYLTNIFLSFIATEIIYRFRTKKQFLNFNNFILTILFLLTIFSSIFEGMRNGVIAIIFLGTTTIVFSFYKNKYFSTKLKIIVSTSLIIFISIPAIYNIKNDGRWTTLFQTIPIALNTTKNKAWMGKAPLPKLPNGKTVDASNYLRVAWFYEGSKIILENPWGIGFGRNAFGHAIQKKYNLKKQIGHSHSGLIDLGIGIGFLGVLIWFGFGLYILSISYKYLILYNSYFAIIVFLNVTGFFSRFMVDSNMRDHMFQTFLIILGFSLILMLNEKDKNEKNIPDTSK